MVTYVCKSCGYTTKEENSNFAKLADTAPDFTLPAISGETTLSKLLEGGKRVVLSLFRSYY